MTAHYINKCRPNCKQQASHTFNTLLNTSEDISETACHLTTNDTQLLLWQETRKFTSELDV